MKIPVSIVIPIYNTKDYLEPCLCSVADQTFRDFEVWMVDDGSTDGSACIARSFTRRDPRFHLLTQQNQGVSAARNQGLAHCSGDYIAFVDSDDRLSPHCISRLYEAALQEDADIVCCNFYQYFPRSGLSRRCLLHPLEGTCTGEEATRLVTRDVLLRSYMWNKLWRRSLFFDPRLRFLPMRYEDLVLCPRLFSCARRVTMISDPLYYYTQRRGSLSLQADESGLNDYVRSYGLTCSWFREQGTFPLYRNSLRFLRYKTLPFTFGWLMLLHLKHRCFRPLPENLRRMAAFYAAFSQPRAEQLPERTQLLLQPVCLLGEKKEMVLEEEK